LVDKTGVFPKKETEHLDAEVKKPAIIKDGADKLSPRTWRWTA
jgi:hypothetical protein